MSLHVVEFVGGLASLSGAAVNQYAQLSPIPDGQVLGKAAVGRPTGVCEFPIYPVLIRHLPFTPYMRRGADLGTDRRNKRYEVPFPYDLITSTKLTLYHVRYGGMPYVCACDPPTYFDTYL